MGAAHSTLSTALLTSSSLTPISHSPTIHVSPLLSTIRPPILLSARPTVRAATYSRKMDDLGGDDNTFLPDDVREMIREVCDSVLKPETIFKQSMVDEWTAAVVEGRN